MSTRKTKPPPSPLEAHLGFWLRFVSNHVSIRFQQLLEEKGVTNLKNYPPHDHEHHE